MLSKGQLLFAVLFIIFFTAVLTLAYKKDRKLHLKNYKGAKWVLVAFMSFVIFLFLVKYFLKI